jgi:hypothetical protein
MVYWEDIESDNKYVSPFMPKEAGRRQYMTFESDHGGWNNVSVTESHSSVSSNHTLLLVTHI